MKLLLPLIFILLSCQSKDVVLIHSIDTDEIKTIAYIHSNKSYSISMKQLIVLPNKFPITHQRVSNWINAINDLKYVPNPSSQFNLSKISFNHIVINGTSSSWALRGARLDENWSYIIASTFIDKKRNQKAGYIKTKSYINIFLDLNSLRSRSFILPKSITNIQYGKSWMSSSQIKIFTNFFQKLRVNSFAYDGSPKSEAIIKRLGLGLAVNNNVPGFFLLTTSEGQYRLFLGRPIEDKPILRAWIEGSHQIVDLKFTKWVKLNRFVINLLKKK